MAFFFASLYYRSALLSERMEQATENIKQESISVDSRDNNSVRKESVPGIFTSCTLVPKGGQR